MISPKVLFVSLLAATGAIATPVSSPATSDVDVREAAQLMTTSAQWTFTNVKRTCGPKGLQCTWNLGINTGSSTTPCTVVIKGDPAYQAPGGPKTCGPFTVTSGWSGQFGLENGFTTFAVVDYSKKLIAYPSYTDKEVAGGKVVKPDRAYAVQTLA